MLEFVQTYGIAV